MAHNVRPDDLRSCCVSERIFPKPRPACCTLASAAGMTVGSRWYR
jgi:hypothetical protein